jgi:hypothetical protein
MTIHRGSTYLYNYEGTWIRVRVMYCSRYGRRIRVKWEDKAGQHIEYVGFRKLIPLESCGEPI